MTFQLFPDLLSSQRRLTEQLSRSISEGRQTLWLVPGGSNISLAAAVMAQLPEPALTNLTIMLTDERYGPWGHPDSNWRQLLEAGFQPKTARAIPTLSQSNLSMEATTEAYGDRLGREMAAADIVIGQFGMGNDGHIAGILPGSPAAYETERLASGYHTETFDRLTMTFPAFLRLDQLHLFVFGASKRPQLERLRDEQLEPVLQPVQIIKRLNDSTVYNDQMEDKT